MDTNDTDTTTLSQDELPAHDHQKSLYDAPVDSPVDAPAPLTPPPVVPVPRLIAQPNDNIVITAIDQPGAGGANCHYSIGLLGPASKAVLPDGTVATMRSPVHSEHLQFQVGDPAQSVNGITNEALLEIVRDRLESFQAGNFPSRENESAHKHIVAALEMLARRSAKRRRRGVDGQAVA